jgi:hypothetical protein
MSGLASPAFFLKSLGQVQEIPSLVRFNMGHVETEKGDIAIHAPTNSEAASLSFLHLRQHHFLFYI